MPTGRKTPTQPTNYSSVFGESCRLPRQSSASTASSSVDSIPPRMLTGIGCSTASPDSPSSSSARSWASSVTGMRTGVRKKSLVRLSGRGVRPTVRLAHARLYRDLPPPPSKFSSLREFTSFTEMTLGTTKSKGNRESKGNSHTCHNERHTSRYTRMS